MIPRLLTLVGIAALLVGATSTLTSAQAAPPSTPCTPEHYMDVAWDEDGVMYECRCLRFHGEADPWCSWFKVPQSAAARRANRKRLAAAKAARAAAKPKPTIVGSIASGGIGVTVPPALSSAPAPAAASVPAPAPTGKCNDPYLADDAWAQANGC